VIGDVSVLQDMSTPRDDDSEQKFKEALKVDIFKQMFNR